MKEYFYFVSFAHEKGFGSFEIKRGSRITDSNELRQIEKDYQVQYSMKINVINYQLMRTERSQPT